jgi:hypothetical protein
MRRKVPGITQVPLRDNLLKRSKKPNQRSKPKKYSRKSQKTPGLSPFFQKTSMEQLNKLLIFNV